MKDKNEDENNFKTFLKNFPEEEFLEINVPDEKKSFPKGFPFGSGGAPGKNDLLNFLKSQFSKIETENEEEDALLNSFISLNFEEFKPEFNEKENSLDIILKVNKELDSLLATPNIPFDINKISSLKEEVSKVNIPFESGKISYLIKKNNFGPILFKSSNEIYSLFLKKFGNGDYNLKDMEKTGILVNANYKEIFKNIETFELMEFSNNFILLFGKGKDGAQGIFVAAILNKNNEFELILPEYFNTFNLKTGKLFNKKKDIEYFDKDGRFIFEDKERIIEGLNLLLTEVKKPLLSIKEFGKIKIERENILGTADFLKIGKIISNESKDSLDFKRDYSLEGTEFSFFIKFKKEYLREELETLFSLFSSLDFSENLKMNMEELRSDGNKIFIELDLKDLPEKIIRWFNDHKED